jgi:hypothetical protein
MLYPPPGYAPATPGIMPRWAAPVGGLGSEHGPHVVSLSDVALASTACGAPAAVEDVRQEVLQDLARMHSPRRLSPHLGAHSTPGDERLAQEAELQRQVEVEAELQRVRMRMEREAEMRDARLERARELDI